MPFTWIRKYKKANLVAVVTMVCESEEDSKKIMDYWEVDDIHYEFLTDNEEFSLERQRYTEDDYPAYSMEADIIEGDEPEDEWEEIE